MAPDGSEPLTNRRTGRSPSASERPERVAQVRTRRTAPPAQPAANPSSLPVSRLTRRNESANSFRFNRRVFQHNPPQPDIRDDSVTRSIRTRFSAHSVGGEGGRLFKDAQLATVARLRRLPFGDLTARSARAILASGRA